MKQSQDSLVDYSVNFHTMETFEVLDDDNFLLYAATSYCNPKYADQEEFYEDIKRFKYIKRLLNRYRTKGEISERLILNHLIVLFNVFGMEPGIKMLEFKIGLDYWNELLPYLIFLNAINPLEYAKYTPDVNVTKVLEAI